MSFKLPLLKIDKTKMILPSLNNYETLTTHNYSLSNLQVIAKFYKIKISGTKQELVIRLFSFLRLSNFAIKIQKIFRGRIQRLYDKLHGPAYLKRELCTNNTDFFTIENLSDLPNSHFFSYKDYDNFIYGFDVISLHNLILKSGKPVKNPYNRNNIPEVELANFKRMINISKALKLRVNLQIQPETMQFSQKKILELRALELFQTINYLGNYSNAEWFLNLTHQNLIKFMRELMDIWNYRVGLPHEVKCSIYPPHGEIFRNFNYNYLHTNQELDIIKKSVLTILERFVNSGIDQDSKALGSYYVLGALTLVNETAADALPWLFQSFSYY
jgi:hypothetical protein